MSTQRLEKDTGFLVCPFSLYPIMQGLSLTQRKSVDLRSSCPCPTQFWRCRHMDNHDQLFEMGAKDVNSGPHVESSPQTGKFFSNEDTWQSLVSYPCFSWCCFDPWQNVRPVHIAALHTTQQHAREWRGAFFFCPHFFMAMKVRTDPAPNIASVFKFRGENICQDPSCLIEN